MSKDVQENLSLKYVQLKNKTFTKKEIIPLTENTVSSESNVCVCVVGNMILLLLLLLLAARIQCFAIGIYVFL